MTAHRLGQQVLRAPRRLQFWHWRKHSQPRGFLGPPAVTYRSKDGVSRRRSQAPQRARDPGRSLFACWCRREDGAERRGGVDRAAAPEPDRCPRCLVSVIETSPFGEPPRRLGFISARKVDDRIGQAVAALPDGLALRKPI